MSESFLPVRNKKQIQFANVNALQIDGLGFFIIVIIISSISHAEECFLRVTITGESPAIALFLRVFVLFGLLLLL